MSVSSDGGNNPEFWDLSSIEPKESFVDEAATDDQKATVRIRLSADGTAVEGKVADLKGKSAERLRKARDKIIGVFKDSKPEVSDAQKDAKVKKKQLRALKHKLRKQKAYVSKQQAQSLANKYKSDEDDQTAEKTALILGKILSLSGTHQLESIAKRISRARGKREQDPISRYYYDRKIVQLQAKLIAIKEKDPNTWNNWVADLEDGAVKDEADTIVKLHQGGKTTVYRETDPREKDRIAENTSNLSRMGAAAQTMGTPNADGKYLTSSHKANFQKALERLHLDAGDPAELFDRLSSIDEKLEGREFPAATQGIEDDDAKLKKHAKSQVKFLRRKGKMQARLQAKLAELAPAVTAVVREQHSSDNPEYSAHIQRLLALCTDGEGGVRQEVSDALVGMIRGISLSETDDDSAPTQPLEDLINLKRRVLDLLPDGAPQRGEILSAIHTQVGKLAPKVSEAVKENLTDDDYTPLYSCIDTLINACSDGNNGVISGVPDAITALLDEIGASTNADSLADFEALRGFLRNAKMIPGNSSAKQDLLTQIQDKLTDEAERATEAFLQDAEVGSQEYFEHLEKLIAVCPDGSSGVNTKVSTLITSMLSEVTVKESSEPLTTFRRLMDLSREIRNIPGSSEEKTALMEAWQERINEFGKAARDEILKLDQAKGQTAIQRFQSVSTDLQLLARGSSGDLLSGHRVQAQLDTLLSEAIQGAQSFDDLAQLPGPADDVSRYRQDTIASLQERRSSFADILVENEIEAIQKSDSPPAQKFSRLTALDKKLAKQLEASDPARIQVMAALDEAAKMHIQELLKKLVPKGTIGDAEIQGIKAASEWITLNVTEDPALSGELKGLVQNKFSAMLGAHLSSLKLEGAGERLDTLLALRDSIDQLTSDKGEMMGAIKSMIGQLVGTHVSEQLAKLPQDTDAKFSTLNSLYLLAQEFSSGKKQEGLINDIAKVAVQAADDEIAALQSDTTAVTQAKLDMIIYTLTNFITNADELKAKLEPVADLYYELNQGVEVSLDLMTSQKVSDLQLGEVADQLGFDLMLHISRISDDDFRSCGAGKLPGSFGSSVAEFNKMSNFVSNNILSVEDAATRQRCIGNYMRLADIALQRGQFTLAVALVSALESTPINRLNTNRVSPKVLATFENTRQTVSHEASYKRLRAAQDTHVGPSSPYIGLVSKDLVFINDGNPDNPKKTGMQDGVIGPFRRQQTFYSLLIDRQAKVDRERPFRTALAGHKHQSDDTLYDLSLVVEPRSKSPQ